MEMNARLMQVQDLEKGDRISSILQSYRVERIRPYNLAETLFVLTLIPEKKPEMPIFGVYRSEEWMFVIPKNVGVN